MHENFGKDLSPNGRPRRPKTVELSVTDYNWSSQLGGHGTASGPTNKEAVKLKPPEPPNTGEERRPRKPAKNRREEPRGGGAATAGEAEPAVDNLTPSHSDPQDLQDGQGAPAVTPLC